MKNDFILFFSGRINRIFRIILNSQVSERNQENKSAFSGNRLLI